MKIAEILGKEKFFVAELKINSIYPNPLQPRKNFDGEELKALAESIKARGLIQPITVKKASRIPSPDLKPKGEYEIVAGERRWRACKLIGLKTVKCIVIEADKTESAYLALTENIQRSDLSYFEEAAAMQMLLIMTGKSQTELAKELSVSQSAISNKLRLLRLSERERLMASENGFSERHARALVRIESEKERRALMLAIIKNDLSAKDTERLIEGYLSGKAAEETPKEKKKAPSVRGSIGNIGFLFNTLDKSVKMLNGAGYKADWEKEEGENGVKVTISIRRG